MQVTDLSVLDLLDAADPHQHLLRVHPDLVERIEQVLVAMAVLGSPMIVTAGARTTAEQQQLYAEGRTAPGTIVTNDDGVTHVSNHQVQTDGYGHAVDCAFLVNGAPSWDAHLPWTLYGALLTKVGLTWGGNWTTLHDLPHAEL